MVTRQHWQRTTDESNPTSNVFRSSYLHRDTPALHGCKAEAHLLVSTIGRGLHCVGLRQVSSHDVATNKTVGFNLVGVGKSDLTLAGHKHGDQFNYTDAPTSSYNSVYHTVEYKHCNCRKGLPYYY